MSNPYGGHLQETVAPVAAESIVPFSSPPPNCSNPGNVRAEGMIEALDCVRCCAILIDGEGRVVQTNAQARRYIGTVIKLANGQLTAVDPTANAALQTLIKRVISGRIKDGDELMTMVLPRSENHPVLASAVSFTDDRSDCRAPKGMVILADPNQQREPGEHLLRLAFGLTPAEIRLAFGLLNGMSLQDLATSRGLSVGTLRNQLKTVFAKTRTKRQSELTILLTRLAIVAE